MSENVSLNAHDLDRLDLFATQILLKCLVRMVHEAVDGSDALAQKLALMVDATSQQWELRGVDGPKEALAREYLSGTCMEMLASSLTPRKAAD